MAILSGVITVGKCWFLKCWFISVIISICKKMILLCQSPSPLYSRLWYKVLVPNIAEQHNVWPSHVLGILRVSTEQNSLFKMSYGPWDCTGIGLQRPLIQQMAHCIDMEGHLWLWPWTNTMNIEEQITRCFWICSGKKNTQRWVLRTEWVEKAALVFNSKH